MRIAIIEHDYPSEENLYGNVFVHVRVMEYMKAHEVVVITFHHDQDYVYEGVPVKAARSEEHANELLQDYGPDVIFIHFVLRSYIRHIIPYHNVPYFIWVHGFEALGWYRRLFNYSVKQVLSRPYLREVKENMQQLLALRGLIKHSNRQGNPKFIFVSDWMKRICETDTQTRILHSRIIPNPINVSIFSFAEKSPEARKKILLIRPFSSRKYATDLAMEAICMLSARPEFGDMEFTVVGKGIFFELQVKPLRQFKNVKLYQGFLKQPEIAELHRKHGLFLCPTRQDAQGVSMCEAMSSGLVPITSDNTAIPEFVQHHKTGFLTRSPKEIADSILELYNNPDLFAQVSKNAAAFIRSTCAIDEVISKELVYVNTYLQ